MADEKPVFGVRALTIVCTNRDRSARFYREVLGAAVVPTEDGFARWFRLGSLYLNLLPNAAEPSPAEFPTHAMPMLWLEVEDLTAAAAWFTRHEVEVVDPGDGQFMQVADPDGLVIEVWQTEDEE